MKYDMKSEVSQYKFVETIMSVIERRLEVHLVSYDKISYCERILEPNIPPNGALNSYLYCIK